MNKEKRIALLGQPNSGKSTIFNALTGSHQHVGNWPGKTVEKKEGRFSHDGIDYIVADLPGAYSLSANSDEEIVTRDYIVSGQLDLVCILADASQLERSLFMLADYAGLGTPAMLVLTMMDVAEQQGKKIDVEKLSEKLGIPAVGIVAPDRKAYGPFYAALKNAVEKPRSMDGKALFDIMRESGESFSEAKALAGAAKDSGKYSEDWLAAKLIEGDKVVCAMLAKKSAEAKSFSEAQKNGSLYTSDCKFRWIEALLKDSTSKPGTAAGSLSKFDKAALSRRWGKLIAIGIILLGLAGSMVVAMPVMGLAMGLLQLSKPIAGFLASFGMPSWLSGFVSGTLLTGLGWTLSMLGFVFGINLVFGLIEEVGYMARVSYAFDNTMGILGLQGKSIMPLLIGFGCTIGGAAGTRVIDSWGQRILTIVLVWAVPCGATFAVIPTLAAAFFGWGSIVVMLLLFAIMFIHINITARIFGKKLSPEAERTGIIMELPPYHKPRWGALLRQTLNRVWSVFKKAFSVVIIIASIFWLLSYSRSGNISDSVLYKIGIAIEPVTRLFGMSWQTFMAFVSSMVSKEAVLGVMSALLTGTGTIFESTIGAVKADADIGHIIASSISRPEALAFMVAVTFNVPCIMAVASTYQETHSVKWTLRIIAYYIATALVLSFITFHIAGLFL